MATKLTGCYSRQEIRVFKPPYNAVLISITDPNAPLAIVSGDWKDVLRLRFHDFIANNADDKKKATANGIVFPTDADIRAIKQWCERYHYTHIFAHCEAGISRSAAIRRYLLEKGWSMEPHQERRLVHPNLDIYLRLVGNEHGYFRGDANK